VFFLRSWLLVASALVCLNIQAGQASGNFLAMVQPVGVCISTALSQQANAIVKVTCTGENFVSIEPRPGSPFLGVHGGAWRFSFPNNRPVPAFLQTNGEFATGIGIGTVTAMRVLGWQERDGTLELWISF
jgi:hypothetical protein